MNRPLVLGLSGAVIVGAAIGLTYIADSEPSKETAAVLRTPERGASKPVQDRTSKPVQDKRQTSVAPRQIGATEKSDTNVRTGGAGPHGSIAPRIPTFDVVRVNPRGDAVIAGRASPHAAVIVRDGQKEIGTAKADSRGEWVVIPEQPLPKGIRELTLSAKSRDGTATQSDRNVVIVVPGRTPQKPADGNPIKALGALAVLVPRTGKGGSIVIQKPSEARRVSRPGDRPV